MSWGIGVEGPIEGDPYRIVDAFGENVCLKDKENVRSWMIGG